MRPSFKSLSSPALKTIPNTQVPFPSPSSSIPISSLSLSLSLSTRENMREVDHYPPPPPAGDWRSSQDLLAKLIASLVLYTLGYIMGSLSAPSHSPTKPQLLHLSAQLHIKSSTTTTQLKAAPLTDDLLRFRTQCSPPVSHNKVLTTVLTNVYNGTSPYFEFPPPTTAIHLLPPSRRPRGWGSTAPVFAALIATVRPTTIIELGTFLGASALHMAALTRDLNTTILCIDDFRGWPGFRHRFRRDVPPLRHGDALLLHQFMLAVAAAGESGRLLPLPFSTGSALQALCEWGVYGDLVEVDAGHDFQSAWADINRAWAVVRPGGVLFGHDYHTVADDRGVRRAVTLFAKVKGLTVKPHGQHWVLTPKPLDDGHQMLGH